MNFQNVDYLKFCILVLKQFHLAFKNPVSLSFSLLLRISVFPFISGFSFASRRVIWVTSKSASYNDCVWLVSGSASSTECPPCGCSSAACVCSSGVGPGPYTWPSSSLLPGCRPTPALRPLFLLSPGRQELQVFLMGLTAAACQHASWEGTQGKYRGISSFPPTQLIREGPLSSVSHQKEDF